MSRYGVLSAPAQLMAWAARLTGDLNRDMPEKPSVGQVTLTASATSTTLSNNALRPTSKVFFTATTANAAAAVAAMRVATPTLGQVVITHGNTADADKTFDFAILNP
jgi:hypothetical protein